MAPPAVIVKVTGHIEKIALAGDLRYPDETTTRDNWLHRSLSRQDIRQRIGKNRKIYIADPSGPILRLPPELTSTGATGTISEAYADTMEQLQAQGKIIYERVVDGVKKITHDHGFNLARPRGFVVPLTWTTQLQAQERGWKEIVDNKTSRKLLGRIIRDDLRAHVQKPRRRAVKTSTSDKKVGRFIFAHNLAIAPHPRLLEQIKNAGQPVDKVLEVAARRVLEKIERRMKGKIIAVAATHLQDSKNVRPHLHVRLSAYDSNGNYVRLFDRKGGGGGGGRCILQDDIEREIIRTIERGRSDPRE